MRRAIPAIPGIKAVNDVQNRLAIDVRAAIHVNELVVAGHRKIPVVQQSVLEGAPVSDDAPVAFENHGDGGVTIIRFINSIMVSLRLGAMPLQEGHRDKVFGFDDGGGHGGFGRAGGGVGKGIGNEAAKMAVVIHIGKRNVAIIRNRRTLIFPVLGHKG